MLEKIKLLLSRLLGRNPSGLLPLEEDKRDFELGSIFDFFGSYTPRSDTKLIDTVSIKDQKRLSNCSFQAAVVQKEIDEEVELSARYLTAKAYQQGLCKKEGYADMRAGQEVLRRWGCCEEKDCPSNSNLSFGSYVNVNLTKLDKLAAEHKTKTYWKINNIDQLLKAIDEGHAVTIGIPWYTGFNQGGGFKAPWKIINAIGRYVGGHAMVGPGYKNNDKLSIIQNSYSKSWGDNGKLYIAYDFLSKYLVRYGAYASLDIEYEKITAEDLIEKYDWARNKGMNVRGDKEGAIYLIYSGYKYAYRNARAFVAYNGKPYSYKDMFVVVPQEAIDDVPSRKGAEVLQGTGGDHWDVVKNLLDPVNDNFKK